MKVYYTGCLSEKTKERMRTKYDIDFVEKEKEPTMATKAKAVKVNGKKNSNGATKKNGNGKKPLSKIGKMREMMLKGWYGADELAQKSGVSKITVSVQASYHLPKQGYKVDKKREDGRTLYHISRKK